MSSRRMKFPYTFSAKLVQFPFKFYWNRNPPFKYYIIAIFCSTPVFYKLGQMCKKAVRAESYYLSILSSFFYLPASSKENREKWVEIRKGWYSPHH